MKPSTAKQQSKPIPEDWQPSDTHRAFAAEHGIDVELEATSFRGHYDGQTVKSPNGRFTTWLANEAKWKRERGPRRVNGRGGPIQSREGAPDLEAQYGVK